jgi:hypothetical protein
MHTYGTDLTAAVVTNKHKQTVRVSNNSEFNGTAVIEITCDWNEQGTLVPTINSPHPTLTGYWLANIEAEELPGSICKATLTYTAQYQTLPATSYREETSSETVDIRLHPSFNSWASYWDDDLGTFPQGTVISGQPFGGVRDFYVGTTTVTKTEYFDSQPSDEFTNIGKLQTPNGAYGSASNWLVISSTKEMQGYYWIRVTQYLYSAVGWNTLIYQSV